jgi:hypothetical protein
MLDVKRWWLLSFLVLAITAVPVMAGNNDAKTANDNAVNTSSANGGSAAASPNPTPTPSPSPSVSPNLPSAVGDANITALLGVLVMKGVLAPNEANAIRNASPTSQFQALVEALSRKGVLSASDLSAAANSSSQPSAVAATIAVPGVVAAPVSIAAVQAQSVPQTPSNASTPDREHPVPAIIPAVAPLRVLPIDPPVKDGLLPSFRAGAVKITPYGFIKVTGVRDSSDPNGDDFPFPGIFLNSSSVFNTGPTEDPAFHVKVRSSRFGANFEWPDVSKRLTLTGKVEGDFEGNFSEVDNADVSSIRNPSPRLRLAYARLDYAATERSDIFFEAGQNWSLFGSGALPNILETTFFGAFSGNIWERTPQLRFGLVQKLGESDRNFKLSPEFAIMMPSSGEIYKLNGTLGGFEAQIGEGEREGADSDRPEVEGKLSLQFQLDKAPGVAPGQIFWSGYEGKRTSITTSSNLSGYADILSQFPGGFTNSSHMFGNQLAVQLPTRWATLVVSMYKGGDMRFMLGGQLNTYLTDVTGLYNVTYVPTVDNVNIASGGMAVGCSVAIAFDSTCAASGGTWKIAPQRPIGAFGGFINLGLPLSRWFNADPKGRNAGWQLYLHAGKDQEVHHDLAHSMGLDGCVSADGTGCTGGLPLLQSRLLAGTLYYKLNAWTTFAIEQSQYQTTGAPEAAPLYIIAGQPSNKWKDQRTEFGPIFTF